MSPPLIFRSRSLPRGAKVTLCPRHGAAAFTLLQLVVSVVLMLALFLLALPVFEGRTKTALSLKCIHHLRMVGVALSAYAADRGGMLPPRNLGNNRENDKPPAHLRPWASRLINLGYADQPDLFYCPAFTPKKSEGARGDLRKGKGLDTYGIRVWSPPGQYGALSEEEKPMAAIDHPAEFFLVADSYWSAFQGQGYGISPGVASQAVHLRHSGKANLLFADGHVEARDATYFETLHLKENQGRYARGSATQDGKEIYTSREGL